jgi:hypothetical protein
VEGASVVEVVVVLDSAFVVALVVVRSWAFVVVVVKDVVVLEVSLDSTDLTVSIVSEDWQEINIKRSKIICIFLSTR